MSENNGTGDKTLSVSKTLSLKRPVEQGVVKQSFSHGRTKSVVVETVKRRPGGGFEPRETKPPVVETKSAPPPPRPPVEAKANAVRLGLGSSQQRTLTEDERGARAQVLQEARRREEEDRRRQDEERHEREERDRAAAEARRREEEERRRADEAASQAAAPKTESVTAPAPVVSAPAPAPAAPQAAAPAPQPAPSAPSETRRYEPRPAPGMRQDSGMRQDQPRSAAPARDFGTRPPRLDGPRFGRPAEGGERRPQDGAPREGGFRREGGPPRDGIRRDGPRPEGQRFEGSRPQGERPAGTVRLGFAPRPGQAPAPGSRPPGGRPSIGGAAPIEELENMRPKREVGNVPPRAPRPDEDEEGRVRRGSGVKVPAPAKPERTKGAAEKSRGRLTVTSVTSDEDERQRSVAAFKRRVQRMKGMANNEPKEKIIREVVIPETITIQELANRMSERAVDVIRFLMKQGQMHKITDVIDADTAQLVAEDLGHTVKRVAEADVEEGLFDTPDDDDTMVYRAPVVTIMGHVDHGKTSLLDAIRQTNVVSGEAGGITQHIGAYQVTTPLGGKVTFIDTPGHAAFTAMRARGAKVTDIVILVVAADDGVMPQTIEAINHAKAAQVPMIVAINKIDKPEAKPERVRTELLQHDVQVESMGGDTLEIEVSAKQKLNLEKLLEIIQLQAEVLELRANPERPAEGSVIEAKLDRGRGPVATVLVQRGTLRTGDIVVAGAQWGRVRALINDKGENVAEAGPSLPVEILGFQGAPEAGDRVAVVESEARAREITNYRERQKRDNAAARGSGQSRSLVDLMKQAKDAAGRKEFPLVIKGDVQGSVEAIAASVEKLGNDEVRARILHTGVGGITESDITLANATGAVVLAFNVRAHKEARESAERSGVEIRYYNIIYDLVDDVKAAMSGMLAPTLRETMLGNAEIKQVFNITKVGNIAGCIVTDGKVERGAKVRLIRDSVVVHEGTLKTLKRFKDEVKEVQSGQECGMAFANYEDMRAGDIIECFRVEEIQRSL
ncbi:MAG: translation initiation factor IF-2 [Beijerinckiaceae bacterium]|nr:translation initiation factor IF-2 [Beijerinckiaceae bacterium]MCZ8300456.1 translation initiation factor IF-2 [Beijerinckiaceae bacterium]